MIMKSFKHTVTINNRKHSYTIQPIDKGTVHFECPSAWMSQKFLIEDLPEVLLNLPETILDVIELEKKQKDVIRFRVSAEEKKKIHKKAIKAGYSTVSAFLRNLALGS